MGTVGTIEGLSLGLRRWNTQKNIVDDRIDLNIRQNWVQILFLITKHCVVRQVT